jgi:two-component system response regulator RpaA
MATILIIEDNPAIVELVKVNLQLQGHQVLCAYHGTEGYAMALQHVPQLVILDLMMPEVDGYTVCQRLRQQPSTKGLPVLMLTALGDLEAKVKGFEAGADDYLPKPFEMPELLVRVKALLRRSQALPESLSTPELRTVGHFTLEPNNLEVLVQGHRLKLTPTEFELLNCLLQHHGQTLALGQLLQEVWGYAPDDDVETIRVHVRHLRTKLQKASPNVAYIETIYGGGYRLWPEGQGT